MKKVLMVVYSFPPLVNPGAERAASFVSQLHHYGWEPVVLTREPGAANSAKPEAALPEGVDIIKTRPWVPGNVPPFVRVFTGFFSSLLLPDKQRLWELFSVGKAARIAKNDGIDLVYTISPPSSAHLIGLHLKKKYPRVPWVADLCALQTANHSNSPSLAPSAHTSRSVKENYRKKLLGRIADGADCIITGEQSVQESFQEIQTELNRENTVSIISDGQVQELSEIFEKACRATAVRKLASSQQQQ